MAELEVDKRLIKNKKLLSDLLEKEKGYRDNEDSENNEGQSTDSEEDEETASENSQSKETENRDMEVESASTHVQYFRTDTDRYLQLTVRKFRTDRHSCLRS